MPPEISINFSRIGLAFDVVAFFMVAPEIIGEKRLSDLQKYHRSYLMVAERHTICSGCIEWNYFALAIFIFIPADAVIPPCTYHDYQRRSATRLSTNNYFFFWRRVSPHHCWRDSL